MTGEERKELYERLEKAIGNTPLHEIKQIKVPDGNRVFVKEEYKNPTGSYYDRVFLNLVRDLEEKGEIQPERTELVEATSGNSGASLAWLCSVLGYEATIIVPEDVPSVNLAYIACLGANLAFSPKGEHLVGAIKCLPEYLQRNTNAVCCRVFGESEYAVEAMKSAGAEVIQDLEEISVDNLDYFAAALGTGVHLKGIWEGLKEKWPHVTIIGVEPFECPSNYTRKRDNRFEKEYKIKPSCGKHRLFGIGHQADSTVHFPHMDEMLGKIEDIILVKENEWLKFQEKLMKVELKHVGKTSAACVFAVLKYIKKNNCRNKVFLTVFYDPGWKYLNLDCPIDCEAWLKGQCYTQV